MVVPGRRAEVPVVCQGRGCGRGGTEGRRLRRAQGPVGSDRRGVVANGPDPPRLPGSAGGAGGGQPEAAAVHGVGDAGPRVGGHAFTTREPRAPENGDGDASRLCSLRDRGTAGAGARGRQTCFRLPRLGAAAGALPPRAHCRPASRDQARCSGAQPACLRELRRAARLRAWLSRSPPRDRAGDASGNLQPGPSQERQPLRGECATALRRGGQACHEAGPCQRQRGPGKLDEQQFRQFRGEGDEKTVSGAPNHPVQGIQSHGPSPPVRKATARAFPFRQVGMHIFCICGLAVVCST
mmetsp:Transcript_41031/g.110156  ORF Transcript_41031/g.110156 Transcript_41031/m.110156 type:complete len:296 (+) Transcript_41031:293-1180(+)